MAVRRLAGPRGANGSCMRRCAIRLRNQRPPDCRWRPTWRCASPSNTRRVGTTAKGRAVWWFDGHLWPAHQTMRPEVQSAARPPPGTTHPQNSLARLRLTKGHGAQHRWPNFEAAMWTALGISNSSQSGEELHRRQTVTDTTASHPQDVGSA